MTDVTPCNSRVYRLAVSGTAAELDPAQCAFEIQKHVHRYAKTLRGLRYCWLEQ